MKKPNFDLMTKEECVNLLEKIRNSLIGCEDPDVIFYIAELVSVDMTTGAENE